MAVNRAPSHSERVRARLIPWEGSPLNEGRKNRLRGGKRGRQSLRDIDLFDARLALRCLERAIDSLERSGDESRSPFQRDEDHRVALGQIALAGRACDDITLRPHPSLRRRGPT